MSFSFNIPPIAILDFLGSYSCSTARQTLNPTFGINGYKVADVRHGVLIPSFIILSPQVTMFDLNILPLAVLSRNQMCRIFVSSYFAPAKNCFCWMSVEDGTCLLAHGKFQLARYKTCPEGQQDQSLLPRAVVIIFPSETLPLFCQHGNSGCQSTYISGI